MNITNIVYGFKRANEEGFTYEEFEQLLKQFPLINMKKVNDCLMGNTCPMKDGKLLHYPWDIREAIMFGMSNNTTYDFD